MGSGIISIVPPTIRGVVPSLAPKVDVDGNDMGGLRSLLHRMPLGTYTGWNPIAGGPLEGREQSLAGGYVPFPRTAAERIALGDPRLSIQERYGSLGNYIFQSMLHAKAMVKQRLLLPEDATGIINTMKTQMTGGRAASLDSLGECAGAYAGTPAFLPIPGRPAFCTLLLIINPAAPDALRLTRAAPP